VSEWVGECERMRLTCECVLEGGGGAHLIFCALQAELIGRVVVGPYQGV